MIRIELEGSYTARAGAVVVDRSAYHSGAPICELARLLIASGRKPTEICTVHRGDRLCFDRLPLSAWAEKTIAEDNRNRTSTSFARYRPKPGLQPVISPEKQAVST